MPPLPRAGRGSSNGRLRVARSQTRSCPALSRDHDLALGPQDLEHHRGVPTVVVPPTRPPADRRAILERPGRQWPLVAQPLQHVPPEPRVLAEVPADVLVPPAARRPGSAASSRRCTANCEVGRMNARYSNSERSRHSSRSSSCDAEPAPEPGPEHEVLRARDRPRRIHLHAARAARRPRGSIAGGAPTAAGR